MKDYIKFQKKNKYPSILYFEQFLLLFVPEKSTANIWKPEPSRGGLEVELWSDNRLHFASVGSNPL